MIIAKVIAMLILAKSNPYSKYVYRVTAGNNAVSLTGFRIEGVPGIVTALHGVLRATRLRAAGGYSFDGDLSVYYADSVHDIAILASKELIKKFKGDGLSGFNVVDPETVQARQRLEILGHPLNLALQDDICNAGDPPLRPLSERLPQNAFSGESSSSLVNYLRQRVLTINSQLQPGHSGAPIVLPGTNKVVAMADGGLHSGASPYCWAIPLASQQFSLHELDRNELNGIGAFVKSTFGYEDAELIPISQSENEKMSVEQFIQVLNRDVANQFESVRGRKLPSSGNDDQQYEYEGNRPNLFGRECEEPLLESNRCDIYWTFRIGRDVSTVGEVRTIYDELLESMHKALDNPSNPPYESWDSGGGTEKILSWLTHSVDDSKEINGESYAVKYTVGAYLLKGGVVNRGPDLGDSKDTGANYSLPSSQSDRTVQKGRGARIFGIADDDYVIQICSYASR